MTSELEFSWAEPEDREAVHQFLAESFGKDAVQAHRARTEWLYFDNPLGLHVCLARQGGRVVAFCGHLPRSVTIDGQVHLAGFGIDFMVARDCRRKGIGRDFLAMRLERFPLSLSIGQSAGMYALYNSMGALDLGPLQLGIHRSRFEFTLRPRPLIKAILAWNVARAGRIVTDGLKAVDRPISHLLAADTLVDVQARTWIKWRFENDVYGDYRGLELGEGGERLGWIVYRVEGGEAVLTALIGSPEYRLRLMAAACSADRWKRARILFSGDRLASDCRRAGFLLRQRGERLIALSNDQGLIGTLRPGCLDLTAGASDADLLRPPTGPA